MLDSSLQKRYVIIVYMETNKIQNMQIDNNVGKGM